MLRKALQITIITVLLAMVSLAQEEFDETTVAESAAAIKIHEFGRTGECELSAVMDNFYIELSNDPTATGYIIIYQGVDVLPADYDSNSAERSIRTQLMFRKYDQSRVVFVNGGFRDALINELWIVPAGADAPKPSDTVEKPTLPKGETYLYDSNYVGNYYDGAEDFLTEFILPSVQAEIDEQSRLAEEGWKRENPETEATAETTVEENTEQPAEEEIAAQQPTLDEVDEMKYSWTNGKFGEIIKKQKGATGVIIFYADDAYYDTNGLQNFIEEGRRRIAAEAKISPEKIRVISAVIKARSKPIFGLFQKGEFPTPVPEQREVNNAGSEENQ